MVGNEKHSGKEKHPYRKGKHPYGTEQHHFSKGKPPGKGKHHSGKEKHPTPAQAFEKDCEPPPTLNGSRDTDGPLNPPRLERWHPPAPSASVARSAAEAPARVEGGSMAPEKPDRARVAQNNPAWTSERLMGKAWKEVGKPRPEVQWSRLAGSVNLRCWG